MAGRRTDHVRAIVLDRTKLGESDLILDLLADDGSRRRAVAKGARRPGGRLAARVELFCEADLLLARGRSLDTICEASLTEPHRAIRGDYERVCAASAVCTRCARGRSGRASRPRTARTWTCVPPPTP